MAIITINTTPISELFNRFANAIGTDGLLIIFLCIGIYGLCSIIQMEIEHQRRKKEKHKRYYD